MSPLTHPTTVPGSLPSPKIAKGDFRIRPTVAQRADPRVRTALSPDDTRVLDVSVPLRVQRILSVAGICWVYRVHDRPDPTWLAPLSLSAAQQVVAANRQDRSCSCRKEVHRASPARPYSAPCCSRRPGAHCVADDAPEAHAGDGNSWRVFLESVGGSLSSQPRSMLPRAHRAATPGCAVTGSPNTCGRKP